MRIGLLTEGVHAYAAGESGLWCDRLVHGLPQHEFGLFALGRSAHQEQQGRGGLPDRIGRVRKAPPWTDGGGAHRGDRPRGLTGRLATGLGRSYGRRDRQRFTAHMTALVGAVRAGTRTATAPGGADTAAADLFTEGFYGLAELAREGGGLPTALRSEATVRIVESACRAPGGGRTVHDATVPDHLAFASALERALRPLSLDWYGEDGLAAVDLCHAASGAAAVPGLLAKRFFGVPLLVTEHQVPLRTHYLAAPGTPSSAPVRALLAGFHGLLASEVYRQAAVITPGTAHVRRWQERCGAAREKLRTVYPGMEAERFRAVGEGEDHGGPDTLVWIGRIEPVEDLVALLHAFAEVRRAEPGARLRVFGAPAQGSVGEAYLAHGTALAARLFPDEATDAHAAGGNPVTFEEIGAPGVPDLAGAYAAGGVVVLSGVVEGFPVSLVEAMFCGRATVSTDVGAVVEVVGGTGLVVPPRDPRALADACVALLRDPARRARLGAAARARALELFTVEQSIAAFRGIYLDLMAHAPARWAAGAGGEDRTAPPRPFATPPEAHVLDRRPQEPVASGTPRRPGWALGAEGVRAGAVRTGDGDA
ncbi:glycosyltransferase [Streptomyces griseus]|uniref:glycosyltransferase n=1 Tax=Streptomyces griseus TaxID=1911 RepID=UPI00083FE8BB|nr:glycosyltransferase [Streptomyces griseus]